MRYEGTLPQLQSATGKTHLVDMFLELLDHQNSPLIRSVESTASTILSTGENR
jgi:hypothetical protein